MQGKEGPRRGTRVEYKEKAIVKVRSLGQATA